MDEHPTLLTSLNARLMLLRKQRQEMAEQQLALAGAIQECEFWIAHLLTMPKTEP
jgi:hypothetical protein